jgi:hypothetical protein
MELFEIAKKAFYGCQNDIVRSITKSVLQSNIDMVARISEEYGLDFDALIRKYGLATASIDIMSNVKLSEEHKPTCMALTKSKKKTRCKRAPAETGGNFCTYHSKRV